jgi:hypothetical protein
LGSDAVGDGDRREHVARGQRASGLLRAEPHELHVRDDAVDERVHVEHGSPQLELGREPVLVHERDAGLLAGVPDDEPDEERDDERVDEERGQQRWRAPQQAQVLADDQERSPHDAPADACRPGYASGAPL